MNKTMNKKGYMVVKLNKANVTICLFNESKEDLIDICEVCGFKGVKVVPYYETEDNKGYIENNGKFIMVKGV